MKTRVSERVFTDLEAGSGLSSGPPVTRCARQFLSLTLRGSKKERAQTLAGGHVRVKKAPDATATAAAAASKPDSDPAGAGAAAADLEAVRAERPEYEERGTGECFQLGGAIMRRGEQISLCMYVCMYVCQCTPVYVYMYHMYV
jgi:hypothetical protein